MSKPQQPWVRGCAGGSAPGLLAGRWLRRGLRPWPPRPRLSTIPGQNGDSGENPCLGSHNSCLPGGVHIRVRMFNQVPPWTPLYRTPCMFPHARPQGSADFPYTQDKLADSTDWSMIVRGVVKHTVLCWQCTGYRLCRRPLLGQNGDSAQDARRFQARITIPCETGNDSRRELRFRCRLSTILGQNGCSA